MSSDGDEQAGATRRRGRPPGQRSSETRERILRAARLRFAESGYARTSLADIAREAGITPRAIYHYVDSKPSLFAQAADVAYERFAAEVVHRVLPGRDTRSRLHDVIDVFRVLYREDPTLIAFLSQAPMEAKRNPELDPPVPRAGGDHVTLNAMIVRLGLEQGDFVADIDPAGAAALIEVMASGMTLIATKERADEYLAMLDVAERLIDGTVFADSR
jgi:AcrR family transcriptional regulator